MDNTNNTITDEERAFTELSLPKLLLKFSLPGAFALLFVGCLNIIDGYFAGNYIGADAMAATTIALPIFSIITATSIVIGVGAQTIIGNSMGAGDYETANRALRTLYISAISFATVMGILVLCFTEEIATMLGADESLLPYTVEYIKWVGGFFPLFSLLVIGEIIARTLGFPLRAMQGITLMVVLNIILDYLFMAQFDWGIMGAALATSLSYAIAAIYLLVFAFLQRSNISPRRGKFDYKILLRALYNGSSEGVSELSIGVTLMLFNLVLMKFYGSNGVAAYTAILFLFQIVLSLIIGGVNGMAPVISYNNGAQRNDRVSAIIKMMLFTVTAVGFCGFVVLIAFEKELISLFFDNSQSGYDKVVEIAQHGANYVSIALLFAGASIFISSYFTAIGDAKTSIIVSSLRGFVLIVIGLAIFPQIFGQDGVWYVTSFAEIVTFLVAVWLLVSKFKKSRGQ